MRFPPVAELEALPVRLMSSSFYARCHLNWLVTRISEKTACVKPLKGDLSAGSSLLTISYSNNRERKGIAVKKSHVDKLSLAIAVCALGLSLWQGYQQRVQNHVAVEPRINAYFKLDGKTDQNGLYVFNNGLGPAYVESLEVTVAGKPVMENSYGQFGGAVQSMRLETDCLTIGGPRANDSLKLGEEIGLVEISKNAPSACALTKLLLGAKIQQHLDFTLIVKSIYGDRFQYNFKNNIQTAL